MEEKDINENWSCRLQTEQLEVVRGEEIFQDWEAYTCFKVKEKTQKTEMED